MVKKYCFTLSPQMALEHGGESERNRLMALNQKMIDTLLRYKNNIDNTVSDGSWDKYKKYTNDYELIFTTMNSCKSVSKYIPISRSFFKLWEILNYFKDHFSQEYNTCFFMAEGPGGFVEAYSKWRGDLLCNDELFVTTLIDAHDKTIPRLKIPKWVCNMSKSFQTLYGPRNDGNICNINTIHSIIESIGQNSCSVVTGDGGFDFSANFNNQEYMSSMLITCEVLLALRTQKEGGSFVLKMYDISTSISFKIITILRNSYTNVYIIKPRTSRPANSEKYVVCTGYMCGNGMHYADIIDAYMMNEKNDIDIVVPIGIFQAIVEFNNRFILNQIAYIIKTMNFIANKDEINIENITSQQVKKAIKWCEKYHMPYHAMLNV